MVENPRLRLGFSTLALLFLLAGDAIRFAAGWWFFGIVTILLTIVAGWMLWAARDRWRLGGLPYPLLLFLALATVSIFWSHYPAATALGLFTTWIIVINALALAICFSWEELLRALGIVLRWVIGLSLLFELFVSVVVRDRILPFFGQPGVDYDSYDRIPGMLLWSRNELFEVFGDGRIQGLVGNANSLGFLALLAVVVFGVQLATRAVSRPWGLFWVATALATIFMTKSATVTVAAVGVAVVAVVVLALRRAGSARARGTVYAVSAAAVLAGAAAAFVLRDGILALLGKSSDLTGRLGIWDTVSGLAGQRPAFGWGWVSYWVPWADPFDHLVFRSGVRQLQAHNSWLDVAFQLGIVGLVIFAGLVAAAAVKAWQHAVDRPQSLPDAPGGHTVITLLPVLVLTALLVQSLAESRLLTEYGLALLVVVAVKSKRRELA